MVHGVDAKIFNVVKAKEEAAAAAAAAAAAHDDRCCRRCHMPLIEKQ
jgi:hypothetical protein